MSGPAQGGPGTPYGTPPPPWSGPPPGWYPMFKPPKGYALGLPAHGPGSLAEPGQRLAARLLDIVCFLPVTILIVGVAVAVTAPHYGPLFPRTPTCSSQFQDSACPTASFPGFLWLELTIFASVGLANVLYVVVDAFITARWGRTPGKAIVGITPIHLASRQRLTFWRALGRAAAVAFAACLSWIGALDYLWCLWDENRQCVHDKVVDTVVVSDS